MIHDPEITEVRKAHRFNEQALASYLARHLEADFSQMKVLQFDGGQSNPTFLVTAGDREWVVRKKPPGKLLRSAHMVEREYQVMTALQHSGVPVPKTHFLCEDSEIIGAPFFVMDRVHGRVIADPALRGFSPQDRAALYDHFIEVLARLHGLDYKALGLETFGKPGNYYERQISRWSRQYQASATETIADMEMLMKWLPDHIPPSDETTVVHGDFRIGNVIIHPTEPRVVALLDWELSTLGHPLADLAYAGMAYHHMPGYKGISLPGEGLGIPSEEAFIEMYAEKSGRDPGQHWTFYVVFQLFRLGAIIQGVVKRGMEGNASSAHWAELGQECRACASAASEMIAKS